MDVRLLGGFLEACGDPDHAGITRYAGGVKIGVGIKMPRTPAVFERKTRWSLPHQRSVRGREEEV